MSATGLASTDTVLQAYAAFSPQMADLAQPFDPEAVEFKAGATTQDKARARQRGMSRVAATLHAAHKVNRICFHLYQHNERFDPQLLR